MKYGVIDIGSNSVRLMVSDGIKSLYKKINTTRLGSALSLTGRLDKERMKETAEATEQFVLEAKRENCESIYVFATEAVRSAQNRDEFLQLLSEKHIQVEIISSKDEAKLGFVGAYTDGVCCVLDIGGGSAELAVGDVNGLTYAKSLPIGAVRIFDSCKEDVVAIDEFISCNLKEYGKLPKFDNLIAIGGTATTFVTIMEKMTVYNPKVVDGYGLTLKSIEEITNAIHNMDMAARLQLAGLEPKRANVIVGGGRLLAAIMRMLGCQSVTVRESDNLEGYLKLKLGESQLQ